MGDDNPDPAALGVSRDGNFSRARGLSGCAVSQISSGGLTRVWLMLIDGGLPCPQTSISSVPHHKCVPLETESPAPGHKLSRRADV